MRTKKRLLIWLLRSMHGLAGKSREPAPSAEKPPTFFFLLLLLLGSPGCETCSLVVYNSAHHDEHHRVASHRAVSPTREGMVAARRSRAGLGRVGE